MEKEWVKEYKNDTNLEIENDVDDDNDLEFEPEDLLGKVLAFINQVMLLYLCYSKLLIVSRFEHLHKPDPILPRSAKKKV